VKVALSGLGGDEVAAGYERHRGALLGEYLAWLPRSFVRGVLRPVVDLIPDPRSGRQWPQRIKRFVRHAGLPFDDRYYEFLAQLSRDVRATLLAPEIVEQVDLDAPLERHRRVMAEVEGAAKLNRALYSDLQLYLPGDLLTLTDRMSMAHSLEVRVPFLDHELLEFAARIPPRFKLRHWERKYLLKRAVVDLLPADIFKRRKMGFSPPLTVWFRTELRDFVEDVLSERAVRDVGVFRYEAVRSILDGHFSRRANYDNQIWSLITFMTWYRDYIASDAAITTARSGP
jgi:asparagine synthase (glutamine-hydrolysing)